jgi:ribosome-associated translation inhibitor RaiA
MFFLTQIKYPKSSLNSNKRSVVLINLIGNWCHELKIILTEKLCFFFIYILLKKHPKMTILFNTDHNTMGNESFTEFYNTLISKELSRYSSHITNLEVNFKDEDGKKVGPKDKRCVLEAHIAGRKPVAVVNHANSHELAVQGAINKLKASLNTIFGRLSNHQLKQF